MKINSTKVGIVTGASQGIGYSIANYLASQGYIPNLPHCVYAD
jgi:short-subunit dehydrogenase